MLESFLGYFTQGDYWLTRLVFQRGLALVYLIAFIVAFNQFVPLLGERGLLPVPNFIKQAEFKNSPSLFFFLPKDWAFKSVAFLGIVLALFALSGYSEKYGFGVSAATWAAMWVLYLSIVNVGQTFYAFGWESMLLEAGFLAIFLGDTKTAPSLIMIFLIRWILFRTMFGAGLIKIRGDACWKDLTCLYYHYETQPIPNPFAFYFHWLPKFIHQFGVLFNHFAELILPFAYFAPQPIATIAGLITLFFHGWLAASGNFSFLGFLTMVLSISTLSGKFLGRILPLKPPELLSPNYYQYLVFALTALVGFLSIRPIKNLLSPHQVMNTSYDPFHLVNSYGAFGSITRPRYEVIIEGTTEENITPTTIWREYQFKAKPGDIYKMPPQVAPYHLRLDWLMWFQPFRAQVSRDGVTVYGYDPWFVNFMAKLLQNDKATLSLMRPSPFGETPPKYVRALLYEYHFTTPEIRKKTGVWWQRELRGVYFPPVSLEQPEFREILVRQGWLQ
jgi:hypothetical protein